MEIRRKTCRTMLAMLAGSLSAVAVAAANDGEKLGVSTEVGILSAYVRRGRVVNDEAVIQPAVTLFRAGLTVDVWANMDLTDEATGEAEEFSELDLTLSYAADIQPFTIELGLVEYLFPHQTDAVTNDLGTALPGTREAFLCVTLPEGPVTPSATLYYDLDEAEGFYAMAEISYNFDIADGVTMALNASLGYGSSDYNSFYFGVDEGAFNDLSVGAWATLAVWQSLSVTPGIQYSQLLDAGIADAAGNSSRTVVSLAASYEL